MKIGVIGLGYVGLPLATLLAEHFEVIGYDRSNERIEELRSGHDKTLEVSNEVLKTTSMDFVSSIEGIKNCNFLIVTVPTPVDENKEPDLRPIESASKELATILKTGDIVVYESTVFPGCTEEFCVPLLESGSGLEYGIDFTCGYSPERVNPGDKSHTIDKIVKVVSGTDSDTLEKVDGVYSKIITAGTHRVSSIKAAEAAKVIENAQRDINIAFMNELSMIFNKMNIDTQEVLEAAGTKWNFLPFRPGLVGGHCIGVDPYYLAHKAVEVGYRPHIILSGRKTNDQIPKFVAEEVLKKNGDGKVAVLGLTFKENCPDLRNSKVFDIISSLREAGVEPLVHDPYYTELDGFQFTNLKEIKDCSAIIIAVGHNEYREIGIKGMKEKLSLNGTLYDLKSLFELEEAQRQEVSVWRL